MWIHPSEKIQLSRSTSNFHLRKYPLSFRGGWVLSRAERKADMGHQVCGRINQAFSPFLQDYALLSDMCGCKGWGEEAQVPRQVFTRELSSLGAASVLWVTAVWCLWVQTALSSNPISLLTTYVPGSQFPVCPMRTFWPCGRLGKSMW